MPHPPFEQDDKGHAQPRFRFRRLALLLAVLLLLSGGSYWYWSRQQKFHVIMTFEDYSINNLETRTAGFLSRSSGTYTFYDWQGKVRWQVHDHPKGPYVRDGKVFTESEIGTEYALSPDGKSFSVVDSILSA
ncbi:MAG: hypothetical protein ACYDCO_18535 [Armatimonadota bacterium]